MFQLSIDRSVLRAALAHLKYGHLTRSGALPVLSGVNVTGHCDGTVSLTTTDLEITTTYSPAIGSGTSITGQPGTVIVPWAELKSSSTGKGAVLLTTGEDDVVTILAGMVTNTVRCLPADEWPRFNGTTGMVDEMVTDHGTVDVAPFADVLAAASGDYARPILTGVYVDGARVVATDSYRLHMHDRPAGEHEFTALLPSKGVAAVADACKRGKVGAFAGSSSPREFTAVVTSAGAVATTTVRMLEGEFPNYRGLVPAAADLPVQMRVANTDELAAAMRSAAKNYSLNTPVRLERADDGTLVGRMVEQDRGETILPLAGWEMVTGEPIGAAFNPVYLADVLAGSDGAVFGCKDQQKPALLTTDTGRARLLMPVRVS